MHAAKSLLFHFWGFAVVFVPPRLSKQSVDFSAEPLPSIGAEWYSLQSTIENSPGASKLDKNIARAHD